MKTKDVPQDDANMLDGKLREPVYSIDEEGNYTTVLSMGWDTKNTIMQHAWDQVNEKQEAVKKKILEGKLSPIAWYMEKNMMDVGLLAKYMGLWRITVKRHLKPAPFKKLRPEILEKYAGVFDITVDELTNMKFLDQGHGNTDKTHNT